MAAQLKKEYYDAEQTQLKSETDYYKGMPHGPYYEYYKNGKVSRKGFYDYGKEDSTWLFYYDDGSLKALERFVKGKKWGTNAYRYKNGQIAQITKFTNNLPDSTWVSFYENGKTKSEESFVNGKKEGEWKYYYDNGQLESSGQFEKDKKEGRVFLYYRDGKIKGTQNYCLNKPCGTWTEVYENNKPKFDKIYKDSVLYLLNLWDPAGKQLVSNGNGSITATYDNGLIKAMGQYKDGLQHGTWRFFHPNGKLDYEAIYSSGS